MFKLVVVIFALIASVCAKPGLVAPVAYSAPLVAAASPIAYTAPAVAAYSAPLAYSAYSAYSAPLAYAASPYSYAAAPVFLKK